MKGFFLLFTISLLVMLQIQRGMLQDTTPGKVATTKPAQTTRAPVPAGTPAGTPARTPARIPAHTLARTPARTLARTPAGATAHATAHATSRMARPSASFATTKKQKGAAPALSSLGDVSILIVLTNTIIQLFHLS